MRPNSYIFHNVVFKTNHNLKRRGIRNLFLEDAPDEKRALSIAFHAGANDYFSALATVVNSIIEDTTRENIVSLKHLQDLRDEFLYLQSHYRLERKKSGEGVVNIIGIRTKRMSNYVNES